MVTYSVASQRYVVRMYSLNFRAYSIMKLIRCISMIRVHVKIDKYSCMGDIHFNLVFSTNPPHKNNTHPLTECITFWNGISLSYKNTYRQMSDMSGTKSQNLNVSRLVLQLPLHNLLNLVAKSWQAMLQLHLSDKQFYYLLRCVLHQRFDCNIVLRRTRIHACCRLLNLWYIHGTPFTGPGRLIPTILSVLSVFVPVSLS